MALETGTYTDDLVVTNPVGSDDKRQGDDHLRLIKSVLKNSLKRVTKPFYFTTAVSKSVDYQILASDENTTFFCDATLSGFNMSCPIGLTNADRGWCCYVVPVSALAFPVWVSGVNAGTTVNGFNYVRRSIQNQIYKVFWDGVVFRASRVGAPIGSLIIWPNAGVPQGHLAADGSAFSVTDFLELAAFYPGGVLPDFSPSPLAGTSFMIVSE